MTQPGRDVNSVNEIVVDRDPAALESVIHDIELGIIQFEDGADTSEEYGDLDAVAADRALTTPAQVGTA